MSAPLFKSPDVLPELPEFIAMQSPGGSRVIVWTRLPSQRQRGWTTSCPFCGRKLTAWAVPHRPMSARCPSCEEWVPMP